MIKFPLAFVPLFATPFILNSCVQAAPATKTAPEAQATAFQPHAITLDNAGFENGFAGWKVEAPFKQQISLVSENPHSGTQALRFDTVDKLNDPFVMQTVEGIEPGATYRFSAWVRGDTAHPLVRGMSPPAGLMMLFADSAGVDLSSLGKRFRMAPERWQQVSIELVAPPTATRLKLMTRLVLVHTVAYFDDIALEKIAPAPPLLPLKPKRLIASSSPRPEKLTVWLREPWVSTTSPRFTVYLRDRETGAERVLPASAKKLDTQNYELTVQLPELANDNYEAYAALGTARTTQTVRVLTTPANRRPASLSETGTILWHGKPFFPIGMYHPFEREADYKLLAANGFNTVAGDPTTDLKEFEADLERARRYGLAVSVPLYNAGKVKENLAVALEKVRRFDAHPSVLSWKLLDEPDLEKNDAVANEIPAAYRALKAAGVQRPLELTLTRIGTLGVWENFCDIMQIDRYPYPAVPLTRISDLSDEAKRVMPPWQNLTFVVQCGWKADLSNQPPVPQARSMVYLALTHGAKGIWWYSLRDPYWDLTKTPLWPQLKTINAEIQALADPLLQGEPVTGIACDAGSVHFLAKRWNGQVYLMLTNPDPKQVTATFTLPPELQGMKARLLTGAPVAPTGAKLNLNLTAFDSRTIVLGK